MKKTRFTDEQMVTILREADRRPVPEVAKRHGVSAQTIYSWRKHFGSLEPSDVKRLRQLEQENGRLKKMLADRDLEIDVLKEITRKKWSAHACAGSRSRLRADVGCRAAARAPYYPSRGRHSAHSRGSRSAMRRPWRSCASSRGSIRGTATGSLGLRYATGEGVPEDDVEAVAWYRRAADQGHATAQISLGVMYANGFGVQQDYAEAATWYRLVAEQGFAEAQFELGRMYDHGAGVQQDDAEAVTWYHLAAEQGIAGAQVWLGRMYANGEGIPAPRRCRTRGGRLRFPRRWQDARAFGPSAPNVGVGLPILYCGLVRIS